MRPIESSLSVLNVDYKANHVKDPNAHQFQAMQQDEIAKRAQHQAQSIQPTEKSEGDVKIRERKDDRDKDGKKKKKNNASGFSEDNSAEEKSASDASSSGLNFLA